jgi:hypothetical protein
VSLRFLKSYQVILQFSIDKVRPLYFNVRIKDMLSAAARVGYLPMGFSDLRLENVKLTGIS